MTTCINRARSAALSLALAAIFPSKAQTLVAPQLQETVVSASRNTQLLSSALPHTTVISREDIDQSQATDLVTLLSRETGLQRIQNGGLGSAASTFIRGAPPLQTLVLIDGVPQNKQDASGAVSLEHIMLDQVERVEIVRGNVSAIYGSGAIGGVIQIFTRVGNRKPSASLALELGPRAFRKSTGSFTTQVGDTTLSADLSRISTAGFSAINSTQNSGANPDADGYTNTSGNLAMSHQLSKDHSFGARVFKSNSETAFDDVGYADLPSDRHLLTTRLNQISLFSDNTWGSWRSRLGISEQTDKNRSKKNEVFLYSFLTRATVLSWVNTIGLGKNWVATAGLEQQRQRVEAIDPTFGSNYVKLRNTGAVFGGVEGPLAGGDLQLNLRQDRVGALEARTSFIGYGYPLSRQMKAVGSVSTAFNAPPLGYLFDPAFGNLLLRPERARSRELGLQYQDNGHLLRATYFDTRVKDEFRYDAVLNAMSNLASTRNSGAELSYKGRLDATDLRAGLTLQNPVNGLTGARLQRRADTLLSGGISHPVGALRLGADVLYSGERSDVYSDALFKTVQTTLRPYTLVNLSAAYKLSSEISLSARVENVMNEKYQTAYAYNQAPRSMYVGVVWRPLQ